MSAPDERRLHPLSWLFAGAQAAKSLILPLLFFLFASGGAGYQLWAGLFIVPAVLGGVLKYLVFRYRLGDEEMVVRDGLFTRTERHIPYARVQNIDLVRNPFHRWLDVALVQVQTASGSKPEAVIRVLSLEAVDEMRTRVFEGRDGATPAVASADTATADARPADLLLHVRARELVKLGIVSNKGLVVVGAVVGLFWQGDWWRSGVGEDQIERYLGSVSGWYDRIAGGNPLLTGALVGGSLLLVAIVLLRVLSIGWFLLQLHDFRLGRRADDLRADYGLLTRFSKTIPTPRIQTLKTTESFLHRRFRRQSIELRTVGGGGEPDLNLEGSASKAQSQWLAPMVETARVPALLRQVLPEIELDRVQWSPIAQRAWRRVFKRCAAVLAIPIVLGTLLLDPLMLAFAVPASIFVYAHARLYVKHTAYALTPWGVVFKTGWWTRTMKIIRYSKIQTVARAESPFDRRHRMASVRVDTAGAEAAVPTIDIPYLEAAVADEVASRLYGEASRRAFHW